jgi:hypothetical protein
VLLEVPKSLFATLGAAAAEDVGERGQTLTLPLYVDGDPLPALELKFDLSVRKSR